jgi:TetR/AcrR family fatty acid metabolism transcriptional regulator
VREGIDAGELRGDIPLRLVRDMIYGCVEHRTWAYLRGEGEFDPNHTADAIVDLVLRGLEQASAKTVEPGGPTLALRLEEAVERLEKLGASAAPVSRGRAPNKKT